MDLQLASTIIFVILLSLIVYINRKGIQLQKIFFPLLYFCMYRTRLGIKLMDSIAGKFKNILKYISYLGIIIGFLGIILISYGLIDNVYKIITKPEALPGVGLVLPFEVKGVFYVPFFYWIISIFVIAVVHEFSHGIIARYYNMRIKSSGLAFLGIVIPVVPAAFVEPDEDELKKRPVKEQLGVFAAGPFSNIALAFIILILGGLIASPLVENIIELNGVKVTGFIKDSEPFPGEKAGITIGETIIGIGNKEINEIENFSLVLRDKSPGDNIVIKTDKKEYDIVLAKNPENGSKGYVGVYVQQNAKIKDKIINRYGSFLPSLILWFTGTPIRNGLIGWLVILNFGIGLFNLVPLGPLDGGRMLFAALQKYFKKEKAMRIWKFIGLLFLILIFINIGFAFIR